MTITTDAQGNANRKVVTLRSDIADDENGGTIVLPRVGGPERPNSRYVPQQPQQESNPARWAPQADRTPSERAFAEAWE